MKKARFLRFFGFFFLFSRLLGELAHTNNFAGLVGPQGRGTRDVRIGFRSGAKRDAVL